MDTVKAKMISGQALLRKTTVLMINQPHRKQLTFNSIKNTIRNKINEENNKQCNDLWLTAVRRKIEDETSWSK